MISCENCQWPQAKYWQFARCLRNVGGFPSGSDGKKSACNMGDPGLIPGLGRSPGEENDYQLYYSCLENPMDSGDWWATVHGVAKSRTQLSDKHFHFLALNLNLSMMAHACESHWCHHTSKNLENHIPHNVALAEHQCPVAYPHNGAPLGLLKGMQLWINTNEPWDYNAKGKRPGTKGHAWYDSIYVKDLEQANS